MMITNNLNPACNYLCLCFTLLLSFVVPDSQAQVTGTNTINETEATTAPRAKWIFTTGAPIFSSPVVSGDSIYIGGNDSLLHVIDFATGKELWNFRTGGRIRSNACIRGNVVYLNGGDGILYALNRNSGTIRWKFTTGGEQTYDFADYFHSSPVVDGQTVYFGSGDGSFYAVDTETGKSVWQFTTGSINHTTPAVGDELVFFGSFDGTLYAIDKKTGGLMWKFKTVGHRYFPAGEVQGSPYLYNGLVYFGARDYNFYAVDQNKGYCHWNKAFTKGWALNCSVYDSVLYIGSADERVLISADLATGKENWKKEMEFLVFGNNAYADDLLFTGTTIGKLHAIDLVTGNKVWSFETASYKENRAKYFKPDDSYRDDIYSIIKSNEQFLEVEIELGGIFSTPVIHKGHLVFSSTNGNIYCLGDFID